MDNFDGIPVKQASQREAIAVLTATKGKGKLTSQLSTIPEFFTDIAYRLDGKLILVHRARHGEYYVPVSDRTHAENLARVSSPEYRRIEKSVTRSERAIRKAVK